MISGPGNACTSEIPLPAPLWRSQRSGSDGSSGFGQDKQIDSTRGGGNSDEQQSIETRISGLSGQLENIFSVPVKVDSGDCMLVIYGRTGNGATDNETQVHAVMGP